MGKQKSSDSACYQSGHNTYDEGVRFEKWCETHGLKPKQALSRFITACADEMKEQKKEE